MGITAETYGFGIRFFTIEKTINVIGKAAPHQKISHLPYATNGT